MAEKLSDRTGTRDIGAPRPGDGALVIGDRGCSGGVRCKSVQVPCKCPGKQQVPVPVPTCRGRVIRSSPCSRPHSGAPRLLPLLHHLIFRRPSFLQQICTTRPRPVARPPTYDFTRPSPSLQMPNAQGLAALRPRRGRLAKRSTWR